VEQVCAICGMLYTAPVQGQMKRDDHLRHDPEGEFCVPLRDLECRDSCAKNKKGYANEDRAETGG
jgi:hypothetical protein